MVAPYADWMPAKLLGKKPTRPTCSTSTAPDRVGHRRPHDDRGSVDREDVLTEVRAVLARADLPDPDRMERTLREGFYGTARVRILQRLYEYKVDLGKYPVPISRGNLYGESKAETVRITDPTAFQETQDAAMSPRQRSGNKCGEPSWLTPTHRRRRLGFGSETWRDCSGHVRTANRPSFAA